MAAESDEAYLQRLAPDDVWATARWLLEHGYAVTSIRYERVPSAVFVFEGDVEVRIEVDRAQRSMEIAMRPDQPAIQYDLLVAAQRGQPYWICFPPDEHAERVPRQLPPGLSWRDTIPDILTWLTTASTTDAIATAQDERYATMWPDSNKAKRLRRAWRAQGLPRP